MLNKGRIYSYQQLENSDCGLTCIRIIARYFGYKYQASYLRQFCDSSRLGISIADITEVFKKIGFDSTPVKIGIDKIKEMPLPAILYWNQNHFVVLYKIKRGRYYIADPGKGKMSFSENDFKEYWLSSNSFGLAILAEPNSEADNVFPCEGKRENPKWKLCNSFIANTKNNSKSYLGIIALTIIAILGDILIPILFQRTIDEGINSKDIGLVWLLVLCQLAIFIGNLISSSSLQYIITKLGLKMGLDMMDDYLRKLVYMPVSFFARKNSSDLIQKIDDQVRIKDFMVNMPRSLFVTIISLVVFSSMLIYYSYLIFILFLVSMILGTIWNNLFVRKFRELDYSYFSASAQNRNHVYEIVNGITEIKINSAQESKISIWRTLQERLRAYSISLAKLNLFSDGGTAVISRLEDICITGICATMVIKGMMTFGIMMTIGYIVGRLSSPFSTIVNLYGDIQKTSMSVERVDEVVNAPVRKPSDIKDIALGNITINDLWFKYPGSQSPYVIKNLSLTIERGSTVAIVGSSGGGKTTLVKLILGLFAPNKGMIHVGEELLTEELSEAWLKHCAVVMQDGIIFSGTILSNIAMSDESPDLDRVNKVLTIACLDKFIHKLPMGIKTKIGVAGIEISGGEKQRLLIARALYKNPEFLILDEATSSLDATNEYNIVHNIADYMKEKTMIIVAHRLSTVKNADRIVFIKDGEISEYGTHEDLIALRGGYYNLVSNQL